MQIAIGSDHRRFRLKQLIINILKDSGQLYKNFGCYNEESVDYPDIALKVTTAIVKGIYDRGILICSTGIGMGIAANRINGAREPYAAMFYVLCVPGSIMMLIFYVWGLK